MSFQQGLSGLNAMARQLQVIGNNIANANTVGSKAARAEFADIYAVSLGGSAASKIGIGVTLGDVAQQFSQGQITTTDNPMDLAINGNGFFQVSDGQGPPAYTRNGQFKVDREGFLSNSGGMRLMGYRADNDGVIIPGTAEALQLPTLGIPPKPTGNVTLEINVDSRGKVTVPATTPPAISFDDPLTFNNATSLTVYDARGQAIPTTYYFQKSAANTWNVFATANGTTIAGTPADPQPIVTLQFSPDGSTLVAPVGTPTFDIPVTTDANGVATLPIAGVELRMSGSTQYASTFGPTNVSQDGFASAQMASLIVEENGIVMAGYTNGQTKAVGQIEMAFFRNQQGLRPMGGGLWSGTLAAGDAVLGTPGQGNLGSLTAGALEQSNVDLTAELVGMITAQRAYQANAQTIKTQDQVLQTLVNMR